MDMESFVSIDLKPQIDTFNLTSNNTEPQYIKNNDIGFSERYWYGIFYDRLVSIQVRLYIFISDEDSSPLIKGTTNELR